MPALRQIVITVLLLAGLQVITFAHAAEAPDGLEATRNLARAGAVQLALLRIDSLQPQDAAALSLEGTSFGARWAEWEVLRLQLLMRLNRNDEVLQRANVLPSSLPADARGGLHAMAAHAALALGRTAVARDHAGRSLWTPGLNAGLSRELRLLVIRSHVRDASQGDFLRCAQRR